MSSFKSSSQAVRSAPLKLLPGMKGTGLGRVLMDKLIRYQRGAGTQQLKATVLTENQRMRQLGQALGFSDQPTPDDASTHELVLNLQLGAQRA